ncbi:MAG: M23 family metallopeptidase [Verrucomicrobia bacterium]|nr:M23 family metallopeptidase [Verrucomicrobiota bacterium]
MKRVFAKILGSRFLLPVTLVAAVVIVVVAARKSRDPFGGVREKVGFQDADLALRMPAEGGMDERFVFLTAWQRAVVPEAHRFDLPLGGENGALVYNAQKFWEMNEGRGGNHLGDDLNGIGGMNTDLGDPVFAVADGLVVYAGEPSEGWGNILVLAHRGPEGKAVQSMYAHLDRMLVARGALVPRGAKIGTVGTAHGNYPAHLHFEMRASDEVDIGAGYGDKKLNRLDPVATVAAWRGAAPEALAPSALAVVQHPDDDPWSRLETKDAKAAERLLELIGGKKEKE